MVTTISTITVVKSILTTTSTFLPEDRKKVEAQIGAGGSALIEFKDPAYSRHFHGIVGVNALSEPMLSSAHLIAKPCPPFCPVKRGAYAVAYP